MDVSQLSTRQLEKVQEALKAKMTEVQAALNQKLIMENRSKYLEKWADKAELPEELRKYFVYNVDVNDFVLENGYYNYHTEVGGYSTFLTWSCRWLLKQKGDYVSFRANDEGHNMILKYQTKLTIGDILTEHKLLGGAYDKNFIAHLTEYVIYTAVDKSPQLLKITKENALFSETDTRHFKELDSYAKTRTIAV